MVTYFPEQIISEILLRLSVKSLIRFRGVCKSWKSLITSLAFIDSHLSRQSIRNPHDTPLIFMYTEDLYKLFHDVNEAFQECTELAFPMKSRRRLEYHRPLIGFENGLICLRKDDDCFEGRQFILWNPSIRKVVNLPKPKHNIRDFVDSFRMVPKLPYSFAVGFGFDPRTNDYMVVRIAFPSKRLFLMYEEDEDVLDEFRNYKILVEVYSLSTGSWRIISNNARLPPSTYLTDSNLSGSKPRTCLNGCLHFTAENGVVAASASAVYWLLICVIKCFGR